MDFTVVNGIGAKGATSLSEALRVNTVLTELNMGCEEDGNERNKVRDCVVDGLLVGTSIGVNGAKALSDALKVNTTLTSLEISSMKTRTFSGKQKGSKRKITGWSTGGIFGSGIGAEGAKAMSEMLRVNTTLTSLNLNSEDEHGGGKRDIWRKLFGGLQTMKSGMKEQKH